MQLHRITLFLFCIVLVAPSSQEAWSQQAGGAAGAPGAQSNDADAAKQAKPSFSPEARVAAEQGVKYLQDERYKEASNAFLAAARRHPNNGQLRHLLGVAYARDDQLGHAWIQFRQSVRFNPAYEPAIRDFLTVWGSFDRSGILNVGRTPEEIQKRLGKPDGQQEADGRLIWEYGFMRINFLGGKLFSLLDPRGLDAETTKPTDYMKIDFRDQQWGLGYRAVNRLQTVTEYVPPQQSVQDWKELFTVQRLYGMTSRNKSPKDMMIQIEKNLREATPNIVFEPIADNGSDVMFQWRIKGDKQRPNQHEIVRLIAGKQDIHRLAYSKKVAQLPADEVQLWTQLLQSAVLTTVEQPQ